MEFRVWHNDCTMPIMQMALIILGTLPESSSLALLGAGLIAAGFLLRKLLPRTNPMLESSSKAGAQTE
jgi:hypothetical protein